MSTPVIPHERQDFPNTDLSLAPPDRGFWTDDEMFGETRASSLRTVKALQKKGLLSLSRYKVPGSQWKRAWLDDDLFVVALTVELADHAGLSVAATVELLSLVSSDIWSRCLLLDSFRKEAKSVRDQIVDIYVPNVSEHGVMKKSAKAEAWSIDRLDLLTILIVDRFKIYAWEHGTENKETVMLLGQLEAIDGTEPSAIVERGQTTLGELNDNCGSILHLNVTRMGLRPLLRRFKLDFKLNYVRPK